MAITEDMLISLFKIIHMAIKFPSLLVYLIDSTLFYAYVTGYVRFRKTYHLYIELVSTPDEQPVI